MQMMIATGANAAADDGHLTATHVTRSRRKRLRFDGALADVSDGPTPGSGVGRLAPNDANLERNGIVPDDDGDSAYSDSDGNSDSDGSESSESARSVSSRDSRKRGRPAADPGREVSDGSPSGLPWRCEVATCGNGFRSSAGLQLHNRRYHRPTKRPLSCPRCALPFPTRHELGRHRQVRHEFRCDVEGCDMAFADEQLARQHVAMWHDVRDGIVHTCDHCPEACSTLHGLRRHLQEAHAQERVFICDVPTCGQRYKKKDKLQQHQRRYHTAHGTETFPCNRCSVEFSTRHERDHHRKTEHGATSEPGSPTFPCTHSGCNKAYSKPEHLRRHIRTAHEAPEEKPFACELCGVRFVHKHGLNRHHANCHAVDAQRPYQCTVCLLAFKKKTLLQAHSYVHTGILPFECEDCGEGFLKRFLLTRHQRTHENERHKQEPAQSQVFMCEEPDCDELLFSVEEKDEHMRETHGKLATVDPEASTTPSSPQQPRREYRCKVCERQFDRIHNLRSHLRTHFAAVDERKLHLCPVPGCGKSYTRKSNVMAHYNATHDPAKSTRFKCPHRGCDGAFGYKKVLETHITSVHEKAAANGEGSTAMATPRKRRKLASMSVLVRALGQNQVGEELDDRPQLGQIPSNSQ